MNETKKVSFAITPRQMALVDADGRYVLEPGEFEISVGGRQPDERSKELAGTEVLTKRFNVTGGPVSDVEYTPGS